MKNLQSSIDRNTSFVTAALIVCLGAAVHIGIITVKDFFAPGLAVYELVAYVAILAMLGLGSIVAIKSKMDQYLAREYMTLPVVQAGLTLYWFMVILQSTSIISGIIIGSIFLLFFIIQTRIKQLKQLNQTLKIMNDDLTTQPT